MERVCGNRVVDCATAGTTRAGRDGDERVCPTTRKELKHLSDSEKGKAISMTWTSGWEDTQPDKMNGT